MLSLAGLLSSGLPRPQLETEAALDGAAVALELPQAHLNCVSTSVDVKSAWCVKACNAAELKVALTMFSKYGRDALCVARRGGSSASPARATLAKTVLQSPPMSAPTRVQPTAAHTCSSS